MEKEGFLDKEEIKDELGKIIKRLKSEKIIGKVLTMREYKSFTEMVVQWYYDGSVEIIRDGGGDDLISPLVNDGEDVIAISFDKYSTYYCRLFP